MLSLILVLIIIFIAAGIIGFVVHGLFWLFVIALVLFIITVLASFFGAGHKRGRRRGDRTVPPADDIEE